MKSRISFVWQGVSDPNIFEHWNDGLRAAMRIIEENYDVTYCEPWDIAPCDLILYWEAPCTLNGANAHHYMNLMSRPEKKILLFAGGPIKKMWVSGFDLVCVESKVNFDECTALGIPVATAFGINENVFFPENLPKNWLGVHHGTCASWKRQQLLGRALGDRALVFGRIQESDRMPFEECRKANATVMDQQDYDNTRTLLNQSRVFVQTCDEWGGGQRATLEAMACELPVVCMSDSPKNREFVEESGAGVVVEPNEEAIQTAAEELGRNNELGKLGCQYVLSKWTSKHYANALKKAINTACATLS